MSGSATPGIKIWWSDEDGFIAIDENYPGCCATGETALRALDELHHAREAWLLAKIDMLTSKPPS